MGKFIAGLLALLVAFPTPAYAAQTIVRAQDSEGFLTLRNLLIDSGGETTGGAAAPYWTASGGGFNLTTTSTKVARGNHALLFDASAASQTVTATAVAIPDGMKGRNGVVSCVFKATTGTATHTLTADDGSGNNFATPVTIASSTTSFQRTSVNFIFPTSGNVRLKITSAADEPETAIDDCYLGLADGFNVGTTVPISAWQSYTPTFGGFGTGGSAPTNVNFTWRQVGDSVQINGKFTTGTTAASTAFVSLPNSYTSTTGARKKVGVALYHATNGQGWGVFAANGDTNLTFGGFSGTNNPDTDVNGSTMASASVVITVDATVPVSQLSGAVQVYRADTSVFLWEGYHDANCDFTTTSTSYVLPTGDASCTFQEVLNIGAGTVSSQTNGGNNSSGLAWTPKTTGQYRVCAEFTAYDDTVADTVNGMLYDSVAGTGPTQNFRAPVSGGYVAPFHLCRTLDVTSLAARTTEVREAVGAGTGHITAIGFTSDRAIWWSIQKISQNVPVPILVGGIRGTQTNDNPSTGYVGEVLESIVNTGTAVPGATTAFGLTNCSVTATPGDWMFGGAVEEQLNGATATGQIRAGLGANGALNADGDDIFDALPATSTSNSTVTIPAKRFSVSTNTTIALQVAVAFSAGTPKYVCRLTGWRIR